MIYSEHNVELVKLKEKPGSQQNKYMPTPGTLSIVQLLVDSCVGSLLSSLEDRCGDAFGYNLILKCIHVLIRNFPLLTHFFIKQHCKQYFKKNA